MSESIITLSQRLRQQALDTRVRHSIRTAYASLKIDDIERLTIALEEMQAVLLKIANRRPNHYAAATAFHRCRRDAKKAIKNAQAH